VVFAEILLCGSLY